MIRNVTEYLDRAVEQWPNKVAFSDEKRELTFAELQKEAKHIAIELISRKFYKKAIMVYLDKSVACISGFLGVAYSGNFYSPIDTEMPAERIKKIVDKLNPSAIITDLVHKEEASAFANGAEILCYEDMLKTKIDEAMLEKKQKSIIDTDVLYVLFTSGSTGIPKGVIISHRGIIDLTEWIAEELNFDHETIMANQSPFYFSFSVYEIYQTLKHGATTYIVPQKLFSQPVKLMQYLEETKTNTIVWVPSILTFLSTLKALNRPHLVHLKNIYFGAEVFQVKHLNRWMEEYPKVQFVNLFGPTEVTDTCTFYTITKKFKEDELLPIGKSCRNKDVFLLDEDKLVEEKGEIGEICMRGSGIAYGYYNDTERTEEVFVQNPLNNAYREIIYRTGDLGRYNDYGELVYVCRKDFQIKHRGRRIELGEIETVISAIDGIEECCCLYDNDKLRIVLYYVGEIEGSLIADCLKDKLPDYMLPGKRIKLLSMPHNLNGKIDRQKLKKIMGEKE